MQRGLSLLSKVGHGPDALKVAIAAQNLRTRCLVIKHVHRASSASFARGLLTRHTRHNVYRQLPASQTLVWPFCRRPS